MVGSNKETIELPEKSSTQRQVVEQQYGIWEGKIVERRQQDYLNLVVVCVDGNCRFCLLFIKENKILASEIIKNFNFFTN